MLSIIRGIAPVLANVPDGDLFNLFGLWMFRGISSRELSRRLAFMAGEKVVVHRITSALLASGLLPFKVFLLNYVCNNWSTYERRKQAALYRIDQKEYLLTNLIDRELSSCLKRLGKMYGVPTLDEVESLRIRSILSINTWLGKFTYRKLRFIPQHQGVGVTLDDIKSELQCAALISYSLQWPCMKSELHAVNAIKRIVHNKGINLIKQYTRQKVSGTQTINGEVSGRLVPLESVAEMPQELGYDEELRFDVAKLLNKYSGQRLTFIRLIMGEYMKGFSEYLGKDNDEVFQRWSFTKYVEQVAKWLKVGMKYVNKFLEELRHQLGAYAPC